MITRHALVDKFIDAASAANGHASVEELIQHLPVGYRQATRLIKRYTGYTAKELLMLQRFTIAAHSLDSSRDRITVVAASSGYADHSHFTREFRSRVGVAPSMLQKYQAL